MFIREIKKKNPGYDKEFITHRLVESYRTEKGPRQRTILNLGKLDLPKEQWKLLADRIEAEITGQQSFYPVDKHIEKLAVHYAHLIIQKRLIRPESEEGEKEKPQYETVNLNSLTNTKSRSFGAEYVGLAAFKMLGLDTLFSQLGFTEKQGALAALSIIGKLVRPGSEQRTRRWAQKLSALDELLNTDFTHLGNNALYRISDLLLTHKERIEKHLANREKDLFSLQENIILYDLTNTYFEGRAKSNRKAKYGRSKEKRYDCPLLTLGLVIDEMGFPKLSKIFQGNISEPGTLKNIIKELEQNTQVAKINKSGTKATVVMDAGIAVEDNLTLLKAEGYDYIVVARNKPVDMSEINHDDLLTIKKDKTNKVEAQLIKKEGEHILYCKSFLKAKKEQSMKRRFQQRFEDALKQVADSLGKKGGTKKYDKVLKRIGRLQQKYASIAQYYEIAVQHKDQTATRIEWKFVKQEKAEQRFSGAYFLRTSRTDLDETAIWSLYTMLTNVEDAFRSLKSELNLRPVFHQKEDRSDAHLFITVLAYHLLNTIQTQLRQHDIHMQWWNIREHLSSHVRITTSMTTKDGRRIHIRQSSAPESFHRIIYDAVHLNYYPLGQRRTET
ncbi:MAG: IS1634 family transposase [Calditrichaeota bacterium]|nr:IS1634 family transposase [Calditrichota bacterium]